MVFAEHVRVLLQWDIDDEVNDRANIRDGIQQANITATAKCRRPWPFPLMAAERIDARKVALGETSETPRFNDDLEIIQCNCNACMNECKQEGGWLGWFF